MTNLIKTQQEYDTITSHWADACKSTRCKSTLIPCDEWITDSRGRGNISTATGIHQQSGWIQASHHILYNIIRNKDAAFGFSPNTKVGKHNAYKCALGHLSWIHTIAKRLQVPKELDPQVVYDSYDTMVAHRIKQITTFLEPFGGSITTKQFADMEIPKYVDPFNTVGVVQSQPPVYTTINTELQHDLIFKGD